MSDRAHKTTRRELDYFESRVNHWLRALHLGDWKVECFTAKIDESASCEMWHNAHGAHIRLSDALHYGPSNQFWHNRLFNDLRQISHLGSANYRFSCLSWLDLHRNCTGLMLVHLVLSDEPFHVF